MLPYCHHLNLRKHKYLYKTEPLNNNKNNNNNNPLNINKNNNNNNPLNPLNVMIVSEIITCNFPCLYLHDQRQAGGDG